MNYAITSKVSDGIYQLTCETSGTEGNKYFGDMIPVDYIAGLETAELIELLIPGEDEEETEVFRERYFSSFKSQLNTTAKTSLVNAINEIVGQYGTKIQINNSGYTQNA